MKDREMNIDKNCYSQTVKQVLLCDDNEEGIDGNRYSLTVKEALRIKVIIRHYRCILHV